MENLPLYISIIFGATTFLTVTFFYNATGYSKKTLVVLLAWLLIQSVISMTGFYTVTDSFPPRLLFAVAPALIAALLLLITSTGKQYLLDLNPATLTLMHSIRIPVEIVLFWLATYKTIPELMTFEGRNLDILSGLTAPFIYYFGYVKKQIPNKWLLVWNIACLILLINIVTHAVLCAPFPFQQLAFEQPNIAVLYFPFILLPALVVPLVLVAHVAVIYGLAIKNKNVTK